MERTGTVTPSTPSSDMYDSISRTFTHCGMSSDIMPYMSGVTIIMSFGHMESMRDANSRIGASTYECLPAEAIIESISRPMASYESAEKMQSSYSSGSE